MSKPSKETLALRQRVKELEAQVVGCEQAVRVADQELKAARAELVDLRTLNASENRQIADLLGRLEQKARDHLSDAELVGLAAEVQAELTVVPVSAARRRLQAALRARGVLEEPATTRGWQRADVALDGPTFWVKTKP